MAYRAKRKSTKGTRRRKAPKGYHYMPDGTLMKGSRHRGKK